MVALDRVDTVSDFGSVTDEIIETLKPRLQEKTLISLETALISKKGRDGGKNSHFIFEIMQIFEDEGVYGDPVIILNSFKSSFGLENPFAFDSRKWDDMVIAKVAYTSARLLGHAFEAGKFALAAKDKVVNHHARLALVSRRELHTLKNM